jgi:hypothetical protein
MCNASSVRASSAISLPAQPGTLLPLAPLTGADGSCSLRSASPRSNRNTRANRAATTAARMLMISAIGPPATSSSHTGTT